MSDPKREADAARAVIDEHGSALGDDAVPPEEGLPGDGESITGGTSSATASAPTEEEA